MAVDPIIFISMLMERFRGISHCEACDSFVSSRLGRLAHEIHLAKS